MSTQLPFRFLLIQHGDNGDPTLISVHESKEDRDRATLAAIFGEGEPSNGSHEQEMRTSLEALQERGRLDFEGDPSLEWLEGHLDLGNAN